MPQIRGERNPCQNKSNNGEDNTDKQRVRKDSGFH
jgi:hypothetical protein